MKKHADVSGVTCHLHFEVAVSLAITAYCVKKWALSCTTTNFCTTQGCRTIWSRYRNQTFFPVRSRPQHFWVWL